MPTDQLIAYSIAAAGITAIIVQLLKQAVIEPTGVDDPQRSAILRLINYVINLALIVGVVLTHGVFKWTDSFTYVAVAFGQALGTHAGYSVVQSTPPPVVAPTAPTTEMPPPSATALPDPTVPPSQAV